MEHDWKSRCRRKLKRLLITCSGRVTKEIPPSRRDRKSTRLNSSHSQISYAVFCLKKKSENDHHAHLIDHTKKITVTLRPILVEVIHAITSLTSRRLASHILSQRQLERETLACKH